MHVGRVRANSVLEISPTIRKNSRIEEKLQRNTKSLCSPTRKATSSRIDMYLQVFYIFPDFFFLFLGGALKSQVLAANPSQDLFHLNHRF